MSGEDGAILEARVHELLALLREFEFGRPFCVIQTFLNRLVQRVCLGQNVVINRKDSWLRQEGGPGIDVGVFVRWKRHGLIEGIDGAERYLDWHDEDSGRFL